MPFGIQPIHIVIIVLVAFLIFGANKLPEMGRSLGKTISEFRKGTKEAAEGFREEVQKPAVPPAAPSFPVTPLPPADPYAPAQTAPVQSGPAQTAPVQSVFAQPARPAGPSGNFCINCGNPNLPEARFCANCGSKLPEKIV
jgi:TatA/E family protein of Tat protein translocase